MTLDELASGAQAIPLSTIGADKILGRQIQERLGTMGLLDPPADGIFGPVSHWALSQFLKQIDAANAAAIDARIARELTESSSLLFPLNETGTLAGRIAAAMTREGHWLNRHPDCMNIVYVEGMDADGTANTDAPNEFNDLRVLLKITRAGNPQIVEAWEATSEPGLHHTSIAKLDPRGAARIAFGQYKAWSVGVHMKGRKSEHEALVQSAEISVHRDLNEDFERDGDLVFTGLFGINQHWGFDQSRTNIGSASAGCLVGRTKAGHRAFMTLVKEDPRFVASHGYKFMTTVLPAAKVAE
jgi:hypothetical protein